MSAPADRKTRATPLCSGVGRSGHSLPPSLRLCRAGAPNPAHRSRLLSFTSLCPARSEQTVSLQVSLASDGSLSRSQGPKTALRSAYFSSVPPYLTWHAALHRISCLVLVCLDQLAEEVEILANVESLGSA